MQSIVCNWSLLEFRVLPGSCSALRMRNQGWLLLVICKGLPLDSIVNAVVLGSQFYVEWTLYVVEISIFVFQLLVHQISTRIERFHCRF